MWIYISAFILCFVGAAEIIDTQHVVDMMGLGWLSSWSTIIITTAVQGALASFLYLLLIYVFIFRLQGSKTAGEIQFIFIRLKNKIVFGFFN